MRALSTRPSGIADHDSDEHERDAREHSDAAPLTAGEAERRQHREGRAVPPQHRDQRVNERGEREDRDEARDEQRHVPEVAEIANVDLRYGFANRAREVAAH